MIALLKQIPSAAKIRAQLRSIRFGKNLQCPRCSSRQVRRSEDWYRCVRCRRPFSLLTGTWLQGTKLSLRTVWALLWCWTQAVPILQTEKLCSLNEKTVRHRVDIHKKFEFGLTSEIEGMFGNLRTFIRRMYHHATPEYLPEYVAEFAARFSHPEVFDSPLTFLTTTLAPAPFS